MKRLAIVFLTVIFMTTPCYANSAHDLAMSYILADQETPKNIGDYLYNGAQNKPQLLETTAYYSGEYGSHGDKMREGYVAFSREHYGSVISIYEAIPTDDGYELGPYLGIYEVRDCGFGRETGQGTSDVRPDRKSRGTIECSLCIDAYFPTFGECKKWMEKTHGRVFAVVVPNGKG